jgi:hypothetical protein
MQLLSAWCSHWQALSAERVNPRGDCGVHALITRVCLLLLLLLLLWLLPGLCAAKFQAQQARQAGLDNEGGSGGGGGPGVGEGDRPGSPRHLGSQQRLSSMGNALLMSAAAPSDVTGICGTGFYISVRVINRQQHLHKGPGRCEHVCTQGGA